jgi:hypothetical protein
MSVRAKIFISRLPSGTRPSPQRGRNVPGNGIAPPATGGTCWVGIQFSIQLARLKTADTPRAVLRVPKGLSINIIALDSDYIKIPFDPRRPPFRIAVQRPMEIVRFEPRTTINIVLHQSWPILSMQPAMPIVPFLGEHAAFCTCDIGRTFRRIAVKTPIQSMLLGPDLTSVWIYILCYAFHL